MTGIQHPLFDFLPEHLADPIIEQFIFIFKVRVKRGAVDLRLIGYILHRDRLKSLLSQKIAKGLQDQAAGPFDSGDQFFLQVGNILAPVLFIQQMSTFDG